MRGKEYRANEKAEIVKDYLASGETIAKIADKHGIPRTTLYSWAREYNPELKNIKPTNSNVFGGKCRHCGKPLPDFVGIKFCSYCGKDIRTDNQICAEKLQSLLGYSSYIPMSDRDAYHDTLVGAIKILEGKK